MHRLCHWPAGYLVDDREELFNEARGEPIGSAGFEKVLQLVQRLDGEAAAAADRLEHLNEGLLQGLGRVFQRHHRRRDWVERELVAPPGGKTCANIQMPRHQPFLSMSKARRGPRYAPIFFKFANAAFI